MRGCRIRKEGFTEREAASFEELTPDLTGFKSASARFLFSAMSSTLSREQITEMHGGSSGIGISLIVARKSHAHPRGSVSRCDLPTTWSVGSLTMEKTARNIEFWLRRAWWLENIAWQQWGPAWP